MIMKKLFVSLVLMATALTGSAMSYEHARSEALFLTDKMAYELNLSDDQYEAAYEINLDYLMAVSCRDEVLGRCWERRNLDLGYVLYQWQMDLFRAADYFFRPLYWNAGVWHFGVYLRYPRRDYFYFGRPAFFASYRGGHGWHSYRDSYYRGRANHYRPKPNRKDHFGMRDGWDRGDYRGGRGNSSTRFTGNGKGKDKDKGKGRDRDWNNGNRGLGNSKGNGRGNGEGNGGFNPGNSKGNDRGNGNPSIGDVRGSVRGTVSNSRVATPVRRDNGNSSRMTTGSTTPRISTGGSSQVRTNGGRSGMTIGSSRTTASPVKGGGKIGGHR